VLAERRIAALEAMATTTPPPAPSRASFMSRTSA